LYANMEKCVFGMDHVIFLGFKINQHGVHVDQEKVMAIKDWPPQGMRVSLGPSMGWLVFIGDLCQTLAL